MPRFPRIQHIISDPFSVFQTNIKLFRIEFLSSKYERKICSKLFKNAKIYQFATGDMFDTFFKRQFIEFESDFVKDDLNSSINQVTFKNVCNLRLDTSVLNKQAINLIGLKRRGLYDSK